MISGRCKSLFFDSAACRFGQIQLLAGILFVMLAPQLQGQSYAFPTIAGYIGIGSSDGTNSAARFDFPMDITRAASGDYYVTDAGNDIIRRLAPAGTNWVVTTISGQPGVPGNADGTNEAALFDALEGITADSLGNLFVAQQNGLIRKLTPEGTNWVVTTIAGSTNIFDIVDGTNDQAGFYDPFSIATDGQDNLYVSDASAIRKLTEQGTNWVVTTIAGSMTNVGSADGTNGAAQFESPMGLCVNQAGIIYVADANAATIRQITPDGTNWVVRTIAGAANNHAIVDGMNGLARFDWPVGLAVDESNNLYVTENDDETVRKLSPDNTETNWSVVTIAGTAQHFGSTDGTNSTAYFYGPWGLAVNGSGQVFVADSGNCTIRTLTRVGTNWVSSTIAGYSGFGSIDGTNSAARFLGPTSVAADLRGTVYVADSANDTIREMLPMGTDWVVRTIAGLAGNPGSADGTGSEARFRHGTVNLFLQGLAVDGQHHLFVADSGNNEIRELIQSGTNWSVTTIAGSTNAGSADGTNQSAAFYNPTGVVVGGDGCLYVADEGNLTIRRIMPEGTNWVVSTIAGQAGVYGSADGTNQYALFSRPFGVTTDKSGDLYVADVEIRKLTPDATGTNWIVSTIYPEPNGSSAPFFYNATGVAVDDAGDLYFVQPGSSQMTEFSPDGTNWLAGQIEGNFYAPFGLCLDSAGNLFVADTGNSVIKEGIQRPLLYGTRVTNAALSFSWSSQTGAIYQVQYTTNLASTNWMNLGTAVTATTTNLFKSDALSANGQRLYRVIRLP